MGECGAGEGVAGHAERFHGASAGGAGDAPWPFLLCSVDID